MRSVVYYINRLRYYFGLIQKISGSVDKTCHDLSWINEQVELLHQKIDSMPNSTSTRGSSDAVQYEILPGTQYSRYAIPLEYLPSNSFNPQWGYSRGREPYLNKWFSEHANEYKKFIDIMRIMALKLQDIPYEFDHDKIPLPAWSGVAYDPFDSVALYTMIHLYKPRRYVEIGSGVSTCFAYRAITDEGLNTKITSIDPNPRAKIDEICDYFIRDGLENCDLSLFEQLEAGDILFFDGTHRLFMNSDVNVFILDILPRIKPGVIIHFHDIFLPWDYTEEFKHWYWNEQYILAVYLLGHKSRITPLLPTAFICRDEYFSEEFTKPFIDLGEFNSRWKKGEAMWFTHTAPFK